LFDFEKRDYLKSCTTIKGGIFHKQINYRINNLYMFVFQEEYVDDFSTFFIHHITSAQNLSRRARSEDGNGIQEMNNQIMGRAQAVEALRDFIRNADDNKKALIKRQI
jgi:hypothetical protein